MGKDLCISFILTLALTSVDVRGLPPELVDELVKRHQSLENIMVSGSYEITFDPIEVVPELPNPTRGTYRYDVDFDYLEGRFRCILGLQKEDAARERARGRTGELLERHIIFSRERTEHLTVLPTGERRGLVSNEADVPFHAIIDLALGLRYKGHRLHLSPDFWRDSNLQLKVMDDNRFKVSLASAGTRLNCWEWERRGGNLVLIRYTREDPDGTRHVICEPVDYVDRGGVLVPSRIDYRHAYYVDGRKTHPIVISVVIDSMSIGDEANVPDLYNMRWPADTLILDERLRFSFRSTEEDEVISDDAIARRAAEALRQAD